MTILTILIAVFFVAPTGSDTNAGTMAAPFATLNRAWTEVQAGDTIYMRGGTYPIAESQIMTPTSQAGDVGKYSYVFDLNKSGNASKGRIVIAGYPGERPILDFSAVRPQSRISAFYLHRDYLHLRNMEIVGVQATLHGHYQSECISARNGSYCIVENVAMHDNMAIGYYASTGHNNLVLNCDAYNNYDNYSAFRTDSAYQNYLATGKVSNVSETLGGNSDGFGFHASHDYDTCNVFRGCRAWWNSDDGFDCINSKAAVTWEDCWAFYNGYEPNSVTARGDGNGFKAGGYGMSVPCSGYAKDAQGGLKIPENRIVRCVAYYNRSNGFYANHHLGGNLWEQCTAMYNQKNFDMTNRDSTNLQTAATDVRGYGHTIRRCVSYTPRATGAHWTTIDSTRCTLEENVVADASDFMDCTRLNSANLARIGLAAARQSDVSLPYNGFLRASLSGNLYEQQQGALFETTESYIDRDTFLTFSEVAQFTADTAYGDFHICVTGNASYDRVTACSADYGQGTNTIHFTHQLHELCGTPYNKQGRYIRFGVADDCTIEVFCATSNNSSADRHLYYCTDAMSQQTETSLGTMTKSTVSCLSWNHTGKCRQIYLYADGVSLVYGIRVRFVGHTPTTLIRDNCPPQPAKYLRNGRVVIARGEKKYDILGNVY